MFPDGRHQLIIENCEMNDTAEYKCMSKDLESSCRLTIMEESQLHRLCAAEKVPTVKLDKRDFVGDCGKPVTIEIPYVVNGTRTTDVTAKLKRNGQPVPMKDCEIKILNDKVIIIMKRPSRELSGKYDFVIGNSQGEAVEPINFNFIDVPQPPQNLEVTDVFKDRCKVKWDPPADLGGVPLDHYLVELQDMGVRGGWVEVGKTKDSFFDVTKLTPRKEYKFRIRAVNKKGSSDPLMSQRAIVAKDPYDEPSKPGSVDIADWDKDHVDIKWTKPEKDGGSPITGYVIEYKDKFSRDWVKGAEVSADKTGGRVGDLKEGVQYEFRVRAINKAGPGDPSDATKPIIVKPKFGRFVSNVDAERITIEKAAKSSQLTVRECTRVDHGKYTITLTNSSGSVKASGDVVVLDKPTPPKGPLILEEVRATWVKIRWNRPQDSGGQELKGYVIEKMDPDLGKWVTVDEVGPEREDYTITNLSPKKKYKFRVKAINKEGVSDPLESEEPVEAKNPYDEPGKPYRPEIVDWDNARVDLKWLPPDTDGGKPITEYIVEMKEKAATDWVEAARSTKNTVSVSNVKENNSYQFRVKAVNLAGPSVPSDPTGMHVIKHRHLKPYIDRTNLITVMIKVGRTHTFDVDIRGEPPPEVVWTFGEAGAKVTSDEHLKVENRDYHSDFTITKALRKHAGKYTISASNPSGKDSVSVDLSVLGRPARPEGPLQVTDVHKEGCKLKWNKPKDDGGTPIKSYEIEKLDKESGRWTRCGKTDKPDFEVTGLTPGKEYLFRVTAVNEEGESEHLETLQGVVAKNPYDEPGKPGTPHLVDWDNVSVELKWEPPASDGGAPITKYILEKKDKTSNVWEKAVEVPGNTLQTTVGDLKEKTEIQFRVVAVNKAGPGEGSDPTKLHIVKHRRLKPYIDRTNLETIMVKKGKPIKLDVNIRGEPPPKVTWKLKDKVVENKDGIEIVNVDYNTKFNITDSQRRHTGMYTIIAENESGKDQAEVEIVVLAAPGRPQGPLKVVDVHAKGCKLEWERPADDGGKPITHYQVEKLDPVTGSWLPVGRTGDPSMTVSGLTPGKEYQFRVKAVNPEGESDALVTDRSIIAKNPYGKLGLQKGNDHEPGKPGTPTIDDWDENHVDLKWTAPKSDGGAPITGYIIEKKERYGSSWEPCLETGSPKCEAKVNDLVKGQQYQFRVKAVNKAGPGEASEPTGTHIAKPRYLAPKIVRDNLQPITIRVGQTAKFDVEIIGEPPPTVTWSFDNKVLENSENVKIENKEYETHIRLSNMTRKESGKYKIKAVNSSGSDEETVEILVLCKLNLPILPRGCTLAWTKPKDDGGVPIQNYVIEKCEAGSGRWLPATKVPGDATTAKVTNLDPGKKYQFRVKAVNDEGESDALESDRPTLAKNPYGKLSFYVLLCINILLFKVNEEPGAPGLPTIKDYDKDFVQLAWDPPLRDGGAPITGYIIEKKDKYSSDWVQAAEVHGSMPTGKVTGLNEGDKYEFRVRAVNKAGPGAPSESTKPHLAKPKFLKPRIDRTNLKNVIIKVGQTLDFDVDVIGEPPPTCTWKLGDKELQTGDIYKIDNVDYNTKFFILKASRKESGTYKITATNSSGTDEAEVEITVLGKPGRPNGPLEISDVHKEGCTLKWKKPDDDGGTPIECYEIEKMDTETGRWVPAGRSDEPTFKVGNLTPGKNYKFRVRAVNKEGDSEELEAEKVVTAKNPFDEPDKPGRPEPTDWDKDHVDLKWSAPANDGGAPITGYVIEKRKKGAYKWQKAKDVPGTQTTATVTDLEEREEYEFRVKAVNKAGQSEPSDPSRSLLVKPRFLAPYIDRTNLKNVIVKVGQPVKFDADVKGEPPPKIEWLFEGKPLQNSEKHKIENEEYHTLFILTKSTRKDTGKYTVTAKNDSGKDEVTLEITILGKPSPPKGPLQVSDVTANGCKLRWEPPEDDGGEPLQGYAIEKMDADTGRWVPVKTTKDPEAEITGLIPGKEYKFRVKALNPEGESDALETESSFVAKNPYESAKKKREKCLITIIALFHKYKCVISDEPNKPGKPTAKDWDKNHVDLKWAPPVSDGGSPITSYVLEKKDKFSSKWQKAAEVIGDKCEARVTDLVEGMEYQFRVKAINKAGPSSPSDPSDPVTAKPRFVAPKIDRATLKDLTIRAGQSIKYDVRVSGEPPPKTTWTKEGGKGPLQTDGKVTVETEPYRTRLMLHSATRADCGVYRITAENNSGKDEAAVNLVVLDKPSSPEGPLTVSDVTAEGCKLAWNPPTDDGGVPVEHYAVEKMDTATGRWVPVGRVTKPEIQVSNLQPGQDYKFRVRAVNPEGESDALETEKAILAKNPFDPPGKPGPPEAKDWDKDWVDLKWEKPIKDGGSPITGYLIEKREKGSTAWMRAANVDGNVTTAKVQDLIPNETYEFRVKAINAAGPGEASDASKGITAKPRKLTAFQGEDEKSDHTSLRYPLDPWNI
ncbi:unc-22 [Cordylochernes scorpioides]|uniref:Unc-22 n=1 Tax=Cordylochernes scorpioides TaxID=51811 RepID=A0ABY6LE59_9ARAC|nr:unc-22 [Cordylochernes scorpioides]